MAIDKSKILCVRLEPEIDAVFRALCLVQKETISDTMRQLIADYIKAHEKSIKFDRETTH